MLHRCGSPKPVLSSYPLPYDGTAQLSRLSPQTRLTLLCTRPSASAFDSDGMLRLRSRLLAHRPPSPPPAAFWAAGYSFSAASLVREVPYDPYLPFLFFGEEVSMAVRMWTRGWDLFAPDEHVVYHLWERDHRSTFWELEGGKALRLRSQQRVRRLLTTGVCEAHSDGSRDQPTIGSNRAPPRARRSFVDAALDRCLDAQLTLSAMWQDAALLLSSSPLPPDSAVWNVGNVRSLETYEKFAGVNFRSMSTSAHAERGGMPSEDAFWDHFSCLGDASTGIEKPVG